MDVGDRLETAFWLTGAESAELLEHHQKEVTANALETLAAFGLLPGPIQWTELLPGVDRVPPVPDHIQGPAVRLLVATVVAVAKVPETKTRAFVGELEKRDLELLRMFTRRKAQRELSDAECDDWIEQLGPEAAMAAVRKGLN